MFVLFLPHAGAWCTCILYVRNTKLHYSLLSYRANDVQVEMVMLDPYVRQTLKHNDQARTLTPRAVTCRVDLFDLLPCAHARPLQLKSISQ